MTQAIQKKLNDSAFARWTALILVALTMFFGYMFVDVLSPLQNMLESTRGWSPTIFGLYGGSEFILTSAVSCSSQVSSSTRWAYGLRVFFRPR